MAATGTISGHGTHADHPDWAPLLELIGPVLVRWFMWMGELALADGARVQAYKHVATRRYLHLAGDGRAFLYAGHDRYRAVDLDAAVINAFFDWEQLCPQPDVSSLLAYRRLLRELGA
jgi:hypothetical protein